MQSALDVETMEEPSWPQWKAQREAERAEQEQADRASRSEAEWEAYLKGRREAQWEAYLKARPEAPRPPKKSDAETSLIGLLQGLGAGFLLLIIYIALGAMALFLILYPIVWLARLFT